MSDSDRVEPCYSERLDRALSFAACEFRHRVRKGTGVPYLTHLLGVMVLVAEHGGDEEQMIAALLHDYLEDIDGSSVETLEQQFVVGASTPADPVESLAVVGGEAARQRLLV